MISLPRLNKLLLFIIFFVLLNINFVYAEDKAEDIWDSENENIQEKNSETNEQKEIKIEGSTISSDVEKIIIKIDENKIEDFQQSIVGIFDPEDKEKDLLKNTEQISLQSNQISSIETSSPQYFSLEKINYFSNISDYALISGTTYSIIYIAGVVLLASLIVIAMLPQFSNRTKSTAMLFFLAALAIVVLKGVSYNNLIESTDKSFFGIQGYGVILTILLLFVITAPFVHSRIKNLTNVYIFGLGVLAILFTYFVGGNTFIPGDASLYQPQIISELNIGDISQVKYGGPKIFFYETIRTGYAQFAFSILAVFLLQYFLFLNMGHKGSYKRFAPYMYIVIFAGFLWSAIFYSVGYSFYKIIAVFIIGVPLTPLVWQFMRVYREKIARDSQLSQWDEVK